jgi:hypothetical protein
VLGMNAAIDPTTLALTGQLPLILLVAAALALPISLALLRLYKRAVLRSMRARARVTTVANAPPSAPHAEVRRPGLDYGLQQRVRAMVSAFRMARPRFTAWARSAWITPGAEESRP